MQLGTAYRTCCFCGVGGDGVGQSRALALGFPPTTPVNQKPTGRLVHLPMCHACWRCWECAAAATYIRVCVSSQPACSMQHAAEAPAALLHQSSDCMHAQRGSGKTACCYCQSLVCVVLCCGVVWCGVTLLFLPRRAGPAGRRGRRRARDQGLLLLDGRAVGSAALHGWITRPARTAAEDAELGAIEQSRSDAPSPRLRHACSAQAVAVCMPLHAC